MCCNVCRLACWRNNYSCRTLPKGEWGDKSLGVEGAECVCARACQRVCMCVKESSKYVSVTMLYCFIHRWPGESTMEKFFQFPPK